MHSGHHVYVSVYVFFQNKKAARTSCWSSRISSKFRLRAVRRFRDAVLLFVLTFHVGRVRSSRSRLQGPRKFIREQSLVVSVHLLYRSLSSNASIAPLLASSGNKFTTSSVKLASSSPSVYTTDGRIEREVHNSTNKRSRSCHS